VFDEVSKFGCVEELHVCDNLADHLVGNVYIKYSDEEDAAKALAALNGRWYNGQVLAAQFCPVTDFHNARCKQAGDTGGCNRGGYCNYMHLKRTYAAFRPCARCPASPLSPPLQRLLASLSRT
jgi:splicing factor U2AF subunit